MYRVYLPPVMSPIMSTGKLSPLRVLAAWPRSMLIAGWKSKKTAKPDRRGRFSTNVIPILDKDPESPFPPTQQALDYPAGLLAAGGDLSPARLINAYRHGIFPWYSDDQPILWWSPAILRLCPGMATALASHNLASTRNS